jgi:predicted RNA-binding protein associated with RNAse of E/G family
MQIADRTVLEDGAAIVWFTFTDAWHDIGRFHTADGVFTGYYANAIRPVTFHTEHSWECTDLFLDVWVGPDGRPRILDEDEFEHALAEGWISAEDGARARLEVAQILAGAAAGVWPPTVARNWTIERSRRHIP